jgi:hypothetical protein
LVVKAYDALVKGRSALLLLLLLIIILLLAPCE